MPKVLERKYYQVLVCGAHYMNQLCRASFCHISLTEHTLHLAQKQRAQTNYGYNDKALASLAVYPVCITSSYMMVPFQPGEVRREHRSPQTIWLCPPYEMHVCSTHQKVAGLLDRPK